MNYSGVELVVLSFPGDHDRSIQSSVRQSLGDVDWPGSGEPVLVAVHEVLPGAAPRDVLMLLSSLEEGSSGVVLLCHPSLKAMPLIWKCLQVSQQNDLVARQRSIIRLCENGVMFRDNLAAVLKEKRIDIESRLRRTLLDVHGVDTVSRWKLQFAQVGRKEYADLVISAIHLIERRHLSVALDRMPLNPFLSCVLLGDGSDLAIRRKLEGKPGWPRVPSLSELLQQKERCKVSLILDAIHGGGQLDSCLRSLEETIRRREVEIAVLPLHATRRGVSRVLNTLEEIGLATAVSLNLSFSIVLENERLNQLSQSVAVPELVLRMERLGYPNSVISEVRSFAMRIGALLEQLHADDEFPDYTKGLGLHSIGLTSLIDGYPGLSTLPIIRSSCPEGSTVSFDGVDIHWRALVAHQNDQVI